jgi:hypothetical protein
MIEYLKDAKKWLTETKVPVYVLILVVLIWILA